MPFAPGDEVVVKTLANKRGVVAQVTPDGRCLVRVENVTIWCRSADVVAAHEKKNKKKRNQGAARADTAVAPRGNSARPGRVDLHGLTVEEALARLMDEIERTIDRGADRVEVVHGKGSGRVKHAVHRRLASMPVVASFKLDERNTGVTWVFL
jgi:DNA mismatch repair protein MutS2